MTITITSPTGDQLHQFHLSPDVITSLENLRRAKEAEFAKAPGGPQVGATLPEFIEDIVLDVYAVVQQKFPQFLPEEDQKFIASLQNQLAEAQKAKFESAKAAARK
jgi:hypothetical protein